MLSLVLREEMTRPCCCCCLAVSHSTRCRVGQANKYPLVGQLLEADSSASPAAREYSERPLVTLYFDVDWSVPKETQFWRSRVVQVAENFGSRTNRDVWFAFADRNHRCDLNDVGQGDSDEDAIAIIVDQNNRKYVLAEDVDADALHDFVEDFFDGKLTPFIKSQPAPRWKLSLTRSTTVCNVVFTSLFPTQEQ
eukprot:m.453331 g.453331  ORF g.453331 m.453331 type:complete len:194 (-) comp20326_c2_seq23:6560-7141(-)